MLAHVNQAKSQPMRPQPNDVQRLLELLIQEKGDGLLQVAPLDPSTLTEIGDVSSQDAILNSPVWNAGSDLSAGYPPIADGFTMNGIPVCSTDQPPQSAGHPRIIAGPIVGGIPVWGTPSLDEVLAVLEQRGILDLKPDAPLYQEPEESSRPRGKIIMKQQGLQQKPVAAIVSLPSPNVAETEPAPTAQPGQQLREAPRPVLPIDSVAEVQAQPAPQISRESEKPEGLPGEPSSVIWPNREIAIKVIQDYSPYELIAAVSSLLDLNKIAPGGTLRLACLTPLFEILDSRFDDEELKTLCLHLDVKYDDLKGEGKTGKARELVLCLNRRTHILKLIEEGKQVRSDIPWDDTLERVKTELIKMIENAEPNDMTNLLNRLRDRNPRPFDKYEEYLWRGMMAPNQKPVALLIPLPIVEIRKESIASFVLVPLDTDGLLPDQIKVVGIRGVDLYYVIAPGELASKMPAFSQKEHLEIYEEETAKNGQAQFSLSGVRLPTRGGDLQSKLAEYLGIPSEEIQCEKREGTLITLALPGEKADKLKELDRAGKLKDWKRDHDIRELKYEEDLDRCIQVVAALKLHMASELLSPLADKCKQEIVCAFAVNSEVVHLAQWDNRKIVLSVQLSLPAANKRSEHSLVDKLKDLGLQQIRKIHAGEDGIEIYCELTPDTDEIGVQFKGMNW